MSSLRPCDSCRRHCGWDLDRCPFCDAELPAAPRAHIPDVPGVPVYGLPPEPRPRLWPVFVALGLLFALTAALTTWLLTAP